MALARQGIALTRCLDCDSGALCEEVFGKTQIAHGKSCVSAATTTGTAFATTVTRASPKTREMDQTTLQLIALLKNGAQQKKSFVLGTQSFFSDAKYAAQAIDMADEREEAEVVMSVLEIRKHLDLRALSARPLGSPIKLNVGANQAPQTGARLTTRYVFEARA